MRAPLHIRSKGQLIFTASIDPALTKMLILLQWHRRAELPIHPNNAKLTKCLGVDP